MINENKEDLVSYTVELPKELVKRLQQVSSYLNDSQSWIIRTALTTWIDEYEDERKMLAESIKNVENGNSYTEEEVDLYVDKMIEQLKLRKKQRTLLKVGS